MEPRFLHDGDPWMFSEDIPDMDFHLSYIWGTTYTSGIRNTAGRSGTRIASLHKQYYLAIYFGEKDTQDLAEYLLGRIKDDPRFGAEMNEGVKKYSALLKDHCAVVTEEWASQASADQLLHQYNQMFDDHLELYNWGWLPNITDMFHDNFTLYLKDMLTKLLPEDEVNMAMVALSASAETTMVQQEHESFLQLVAKQQAGASEEEMHQAIQEHTDKYFYFKHLWIGTQGVYDFNYYKTELDKYVQNGTDAAEFLKKEQVAVADTLRQRDEYIRRLQFDDKTKGIFDAYAGFAVTKLYRRDAQIYWCYKLGILFRELAGRWNVTLEVVRCLRPDEIRQAITKGSLDAAVIQAAEDRFKLAVHYQEDGVDIIWTGEEAASFEKVLPQRTSVESVKELRGHTACLGKAEGKVTIIDSVADLHKMEQGDILVSIATNPDVVPAMKKAGAIVTEQGGITSHAAIVSRELHVPCIIGVKGATKLLKDGDRIIVDATRGTITLIEDEHGF